MRKSILKSLFWLSIGAGLLTGCGPTMHVTRYPTFWDYPGEFQSIAIAPTSGSYGYEADSVIDNNVYASGWYDYYDYSNADAADLVVTPVVSNYSLEYTVNVGTREEVMRAEYDDGYYVDLPYAVNYADTTFEGWGKVYVTVSSAKRGGVIDTITASDTCTESEHFEPRLPPSYIHLHGGPGPNGEHPHVPREPVPPAPRTESADRVQRIAVNHARRVIDDYDYLINCAVRSAASMASTYLYPVSTTIRLKEKRVFKFFQNDEEVSSISLKDGDEFLIVFALPDEASFNNVTVHVVASNNEKNALVTHNIQWDKAIPQLQFTLSASALMEASGGQTKYDVQLWKDGKFILDRSFKLK